MRATAGSKNCLFFINCKVQCLNGVLTRKIQLASEIRIPHKMLIQDVSLRVHLLLFPSDAEAKSWLYSFFSNRSYYVQKVKICGQLQDFSAICLNWLNVI